MALKLDVPIVENLSKEELEIITISYDFLKGRLYIVYREGNRDGDNNFVQVGKPKQIDIDDVTALDVLRPNFYNRLKVQLGVTGTVV